MRNRCLVMLALLMIITVNAWAQKVKFIEYDLDNGLHVILHQDRSAPVVNVSVMYHVGAKDESPDRTGFAHFFEHLLFEGSKNIKRGEFMNFVSQGGGQNNANTSWDRTYYFETMPSNELETALWLESERMLHPVINEIGVKTQNEVVKEEKRQRVDNAPYGKFVDETFRRLFKAHPYRWPIIGSMEHLDAAELGEFKAFFNKFYVPGNAVLVVVGDFDVEKTKQLVKDYFGEVPKGNVVKKAKFSEVPITKEMIDTAYDANIRVPAISTSYRVPGMSSREKYVLDLVSSLLSGRGSSRLSKKMIDEKKNAVQLQASGVVLEDYGIYSIIALPNGKTRLEELLKDIDEEVAKLQQELISEKEYQKLQNMIENSSVGSNQSMGSIAENLASAYTFYRNTNLVNTEPDIYRSVTREEIRDFARKYLNRHQRLVLYYLPKK